MDELRTGIVTVSDRVATGRVADRGGPRIADLLRDCQTPRFIIAEMATVADERDAIAGLLRRLAQSCTLIVTTGGTGLGPRDVTPEATLDVIERRVPGMEEAMRSEGRRKTPLAMLSRAVVGSVGSCLIVNLPGSPTGAQDGLEAVLPALPHAVRLLQRQVADCAPERAPFES